MSTNELTGFNKERNNEKSNLKSTTKPYASKSMPKKGHPMRTRKKPAPKEMVPCSLHQLIIHYKLLNPSSYSDLVVQTL
jgi:hypothetical protein